MLIESKYVLILLLLAELQIYFLCFVSKFKQNIFSSQQTFHSKLEKNIIYIKSVKSFILFAKLFIITRCRKGKNKTFSLAFMRKLAKEKDRVN